MVRALVVQYGDSQHEYLGAAVEFLLRQTPTPTSIDVLLPEPYSYASAWIKFFQANYSTLIPVQAIPVVEGEYVHTFYLTSNQALTQVATRPPATQCYGLVHSVEQLVFLPRFRNLRLTPLLKVEAELIPAHFRCLQRDYVPDYFPTVKYFLNEDSQQLAELGCCFARLKGSSLAHVNGKTLQGIVGLPVATVEQLISLYLHKTLICYPTTDSCCLKDRLATSAYLSTSFTTPTLMWQPLYDIYRDQILQHHCPVTPFASTWELDNYLQGRWLTGLLVEPRELRNVLPLIENFYQVLGDVTIPLHFYCGKGMETRWRQRIPKK
jgi:hypothetical protein